METTQILIIVTLLAILAEVTYMVAKMPRPTLGKKQGRPIFVDTSVLIDGRIIPVAKSGFISDPLVIPRSVIGELQFLADNADHDKRSRARYGLDVVQELQALPGVDVEIHQDGSKAAEGVDERLLTLAKKYDGVICTIDYNLNKVAVVESIQVLNVNELAQSLRMAYLPGERMNLELVQKGQDAHQAVGYLTDGTMVVVEHSNKLIGQTVEIEFIRSLQTAAGKMMFARRVDASVAHTPKPAQKPIGKKPVPQQPKQEKNEVRSATEDRSQQQKQQQPKAQPVQQKQKVVTKPQTAVYHSDSREAVRAQTPKNDDGIEQADKKRPNKNRGKKRRTSNEREASFVDLANKQ
jgi:rRNA-processing protein FCF1